jgi:hypothetical protein
MLLNCVVKDAYLPNVKFITLPTTQPAHTTSPPTMSAIVMIIVVKIIFEVQASPGLHLAIQTHLSRVSVSYTGYTQVGSHAKLQIWINSIASEVVVVMTLLVLVYMLMVLFAFNTW